MKISQLTDIIDSPSLLPFPNQMLALSLLESIMSIDWKSQWLRFLVVRGYLQSVCASVQWEDEALQKMLHPQPDALRALYIYQSKMVRIRDL